jgi:hypothetical protein
MRRSMAALLLLAAVAGCDASITPVAPVDGPVRGLGFADPISSFALAELEAVGNVLSVIHSARVVMVTSSATPEQLHGVPGAPHVGPILGEADSVLVEAAVVFLTAAGEADLRALAAIGTIIQQFPEYRAVFLMVRVRDLDRLDGVSRVESVWVGYDPSLR